MKVNMTHENQYSKTFGTLLLLSLLKQQVRATGTYFTDCVPKWKMNVFLRRVNFVKQSNTNSFCKVMSRVFKHRFSFSGNVKRVILGNNKVWTREKKYWKAWNAATILRKKYVKGLSKLVEWIHLASRKMTNYIAQNHTECKKNPK